VIDEPFESDELGELRATSAAAAELARDEESFKAAYEAFLASDAAAFQAILDKHGLGERCRLICRFFCRKHCPSVCRRFCPDRPAPVDANEIREFALVLARLTADDELLKRLLEIVGSGDVEAWQEELKRLELGRYCHQLCHFLCVVHCRRRCQKLCPPAPMITNVGSIPTPSQVDAQGFGNGPGVPPANVPFPNPAAGVGDHPFGGTPTIKGIFNMATASEYKLEVADNPGGPYTPIAVPVVGRNYVGPPFWVVSVTRNPSSGPDPGWYKVSEIADSDGGPNAIGEKRLLDWPTGSLKDGIYYLRLRVRDGAGTERRSSPQIIQTDNTAPAKPLIKLELQTPSGDLRPLKCGKVRRGDGLIRVTIQASDPNFSRLSVAAQGNSGLSIDVVGVPEGSPPGTPAVPLSKTYNGNLADQGYPVPTSFLWDPWSDERLVSCCYVVRIDIADRALSSNVWAGGHSSAGWEAIEIGF
jgi:hypothetical protein